MSKIEAFKCDVCDCIVERDMAFGVSPQPDMLDKLSGFRTIMNPDKAEIHYCQDCYSAKVIVPASQFRKPNEESLYKLKMEEFAYGLRGTAVARYNNRQKAENQRRKK